MSSTLGAVHRPAVMMGDVIPAPPRFRFHGEWLLERPRDDLHAQLLDLEHYVDWWPEVRAVASLGPDDARVLIRSRLPWTLDLVLHAASRSPELLERSEEHTSELQSLMRTSYAVFCL